ncbi:HAD-IIA family hydrolase [Kribbella sp. NPDC059898]|uniref:HAD-IIA family hydrolase n=1 Tax=Kribbella sp. NPDC059898 TaxID=3346995 RepID=UPI00364EBD6D
MTAEPLMTRYRGLICDLDGVVYRGAAAVPGAIETLNDLIADGVQVAFATNNASRPRDAVQGHLRALGLRPGRWSAVTSAQAAASYLSARLPPQTPVLAVGGAGVADALADVALRPVRASELTGTPVAAVVQGLGADVSWSELAEVGYLVQAGTTWVVTNLDLMLPTARGAAPGNGALVAAVQSTTTAIPHVVGKPGPALFDLARSRLGTGPAATLVCGDRLDTDIAGANAAGLDSILVLSGAARLQDLAFAPPAERPTYVATGLTGLLQPPLRLRVEPTDHLEAGPDALLRPHSAGNRSVIQSVVAAAWAACDQGRVVLSDRSTWHALEHHLGLTVEA